MTDSKPAVRLTPPPNAAVTMSQANASIDTSQTEVPRSAMSNAPETPVPSQFGRYKIEKELGKGAMGVVYLAVDTQLHRKVALKIPKKSILEEPEALERFYREARTTATLRHNNICPVYDVGAIDGTHYLTMAYIPGKPVNSFLVKGKLPAAKVVALLIRKIALALDEAHRNGVVHRDLKPANVMLDDRGEPIVMDFGLACNTNTTEQARLTQSGAILGTPAYMAPEQVRGELNQIGPQSDIYALGVMMYQFLTGELPFNGPVMMVFAQILRDQPKKPSEIRPDVDPTLEAICLKMTAKEAAQRYASMRDVAVALTEFVKKGSASGQETKSTVTPVATVAEPEPQPVANVENLPAFPDLVVKDRPQKKMAKSQATGGTGTWCWLRNQPWFWPVAGGLGSLPLVILLAVIYVQLGKSMVRIEIEETDPPLTVRFGKEELTIHNDGAPITVRPGKHTLLVSRDGLKTETREFTLNRGDKKLAAVSLSKGKYNLVLTDDIESRAKVADMPKPRPLAETEETKNRWFAHVPTEEELAAGKGINYADGVFRTVDSAHALLTFTSVQSADQSIRASVKLLDAIGPEAPNISLGTRHNAKGAYGCWYRAGQLGIGMTLDGEFRDLAVIGNPARPDEFVDLSFSAIGNQLTVTLNGQSVLSIQDSTHPSGSPAIASWRCRGEFRNVEIQLPVFTNTLGMEFVKVPKGKSWLGGCGGKFGDTEVECAEDFYLGKYEVTQEEWEKITGSNPSYYSRMGARKEAVKDISDADLKRFPVETVSWNETQLFLKVLNSQVKETGWEYRLPTEMEWEYACRGGPMTDRFDSSFNFYLDKPTNQLFLDQANFEHGKGLQRTCRVGSYHPTRLGLYDIHGNVWEWCADTLKAADGAAQRVIRGGSWYNDAGSCTTVIRSIYGSSHPDPVFGLRLARVPAGNKGLVALVPMEKPQLSEPYKNSLGMEFVRIPKGKSWLGGGGGKFGDDEVELKEDFYLGKYEVTQAEWEKVMGSNPSHFSRNGPGKDAVKDVSDSDLKRFPVEMVSWDDCQEFLKKLNEQIKDAGIEYRLPTQREWEYACRGGPMTDRFESAFDYYVDKPTNQLLPDQANHAHEKSLKRTFPVGTFQPNRLGLYDMHGSVWEWCALVLSQDEAKNLKRAAGGGSYNHPAIECLATSFALGLPSERFPRTGLRLVRAPVGKLSLVTPVPAAKAEPLVPPYKNSLGMEFVKVPKGKSWLGGGGGQPGNKDVEFKDDFYLGKYEVTQEEWEKVMGNNPSHFSRNGPGKDAVKDISDADLKRFPVELVSWDDCKTFLAKLNEQVKEPGWQYRLPKETEWEYACRGGPMADRFDRHFDFYLDRPMNRLQPNQANFEYGNGLKQTCKVGSYKPNKLGLYDLHGNAWEWCDDLFDSSDPARASLRNRRGGQWAVNAEFCRAADRSADVPTYRDSSLGVRLARVPVGTNGAKQNPPAASNLSKSTDEFTPLFNGKDLTGWEVHPKEGAWEVKDGVLFCRRGPRSHLFTIRDDYREFHLRTEMRINQNGNSGVWFWCEPAPIYPSGFEVDVMQGTNRAGTVHRFSGGWQERYIAQDVSVPQNEWFPLEVIVQNGRAKTIVNGKTAVDVGLPKKYQDRGRLAFQFNDEPTAVEFRKLEIKELSSKAK